MFQTGRSKGGGVVLALLVACQPPEPGDRAEGDGPRTVDLVWIPDVGGDDWDEARAGLWWALSDLGALPPEDEAALVVQEMSADGVRFSLDLDGVGFPEGASSAVDSALEPILAAADREGPVDVGRFLLATLYTPDRYYALTGACPTLDAWRATRMAPDPLLYGVSVSLLVDGERLVELAPLTGAAADEGGVGDIAFVAHEGEGSLADGSFVSQETEVLDILPNGQERYAIYDGEGRLSAAASTEGVGQPGKCLWCHEATIQRGTSANPTIAPYLSYAEFVAEVEAAEARMAVARSVPSAVDWDGYVAHEWAESLTNTFLEPSAARVAREWGVPTAEVEALGLPTHTSSEHPERGATYLRADVDAAHLARDSGWSPLEVPSSDREADPAPSPGGRCGD